MENKSKVILQPKVTELTTYSRSHIWRLERSGQFPKRLKLGPNRVGWLESEIDAWIQAKAYERRVVANEGAN